LRGRLTELSLLRFRNGTDSITPQSFLRRLQKSATPNKEINLKTPLQIATSKRKVSTAIRKRIINEFDSKSKNGINKNKG